MSITVTEKQELRDIINSKIDRKVSQIEIENSKEFGKLKEQARLMAIDQLELADYLQREANATASIARIEESRDEARKQTATRLGIEKDWRPEQEIEKKLESATEIVYAGLMDKHPIGSGISRLRKEQEAMLETVWMATSSSQVKELFQRVNEVLDEKPSDLGKKALDIKPVEG